MCDTCDLFSKRPKFCVKTHINLLYLQIMAINIDWRDEIRKKLIEILSDSINELIRVLWYLDEEDKQYKDEDRVPPVWQTLRSASKSSDNLFKQYVSRIVKDTESAEKDPAFRQFMQTTYSHMLEASEQPPPDGVNYCLDVSRLTNMSVAQRSGFIGLAQAWSMIPMVSQKAIIETIPKIITNRMVINSIDEMVSLVNKTGGTVVMVALAAISLGADVINNLNRWWTGQITGKRCAKNIVDSATTIGAGVAGGMGGAAIGSLFGPIGTLVGGIAGGILSAQGVSYLIDGLTQRIFGVPKDEALERAYNYFGVHIKASNHEINQSFRQKCLTHHPDRGGKHEDFLFVQLHMATIKMSRGDLS